MIKESDGVGFEKKRAFTCPSDSDQSVQIAREESMTVGSMRLAASEEVFETRHRAGREMEGRKKKGAAGEKNCRI